MLIRNQFDGRLYEVPDHAYGGYGEYPDYGYSDPYAGYGHPGMGYYAGPGIGFLPALLPAVTSLLPKVLPAVANVASKVLPGVVSSLLPGGGSAPSPSPAPAPPVPAPAPAPAPTVIRMAPPAAPAIPVEEIAQRVASLLRPAMPPPPQPPPMPMYYPRPRRRR